MAKKLLSVFAVALFLTNAFSIAYRLPKAGADVTVQVIGGDPPWTDWVHYHDYTEIVNTLLYLNSSFSGIVDLFSIGESWGNRTIYCVRMTNEANTDPKPKLFFVGYHHAREPISAELPLYFALTTAMAYGFNESVTRMLNYCEIYIVVALNVDGFEAVRKNEWQRKNSFPVDEDNDGSFDEDLPDDEDGDGYIEDLGTTYGGGWTVIRWEGVDDDLDGNFNEDWAGGVDLNRNYGYQWNATVDSGSDDPSAEDFRGPGAFSERETKAVRDLCVQNDFSYAVSFHSGAESILYPWGYTNEASPDDQLFREIAGGLSDLVGALNEQSGAWYTTSGVWDDWMYGNRSVLAFTCEIYGNDSAWQYEPGPAPNTYWERGITQAFNPDPRNIESVVRRWLPVFTYMTERAIAKARALICDINGDGWVNGSDAVLLGVSMGWRPGDPNWNPAADFNNDAYVNAKDAVLLGTRFGEHR